ncbi:hypothetical protein EYE42_01990 [Paracoccus subflavus]|uniref:Uncharacterized protein n=1 Tax=Paracoccus subflavus TaxID=2528244 RepID=A0A4Q9G7X9_9RHOB|nr:hypothetical protein [Paracoccus subflavus]TBN43916.1 hypothetical protein EYE42_01990 [Paracoccus subflavus]
MSDSPAYTQLLTLIAARSQNWVRQQINLLDPTSGLDDAADAAVAEIALTAQVCGGFRGTEAPLQVFLRNRLGAGPGPSPEWLLASRSSGLEPGGLPERMMRSGPSDPALLAEAEALLRQPVPDERLTDQSVDTYARVLALCYRFGAERPRFARARTYGDAFANCLRFADWAERRGRLMPLAQMVFCLYLIDPDHDASAMLADVIASQRPDGSFPMRMGFGTAEGTGLALRPTLAVLLALHAAIYRRWSSPRPGLSMAA